MQLSGLSSSRWLVCCYAIVWFDVKQLTGLLLCNCLVCCQAVVWACMFLSRSYLSLSPSEFLSASCCLNSQAGEFLLSCRHLGWWTGEFLSCRYLGWRTGEFLLCRYLGRRAGEFLLSNFPSWKAGWVEFSCRIEKQVSSCCRVEKQVQLSSRRCSGLKVDEFLLSCRKVDWVEFLSLSICLCW